MKQHKDERDYNIRSVERALNALQCFNGGSREISLMEFSQNVVPQQKHHVSEF